LESLLEEKKIQQKKW